MTDENNAFPTTFTTIKTTAEYIKKPHILIWLMDHKEPIPISAKDLSRVINEIPGFTEALANNLIVALSFCDMITGKIDIGGDMVDFEFNQEVNHSPILFLPNSGTIHNINELTSKKDPGSQSLKDFLEKHNLKNYFIGRFGDTVIFADLARGDRFMTEAEAKTIGYKEPGPPINSPITTDESKQNEKSLKESNYIEESKKIVN